MTRRSTEKLSATAVAKSKHTIKAYKLADGGGLYLYVAPIPSRARSWRYDYRIAGKRETLVLGQYPDLELAEAREAHRAARKLVARGESPSQAKRVAKLSKMLQTANTFAATAEEWFDKKKGDKSASWKDNVRRWLDKEIYPAIGRKPLADVTPADVLAMMRAMSESGKPKSAEYARQVVAQVFQYAIQNLRTKFNPAREVQGAIVIPAPRKRPPLSEKELPAFLHAIDRYCGRPETKLALRLLALTFTRKSELVEAQWPELDLDGAEWRIPAERMKAAERHIVPLAPQAVEAFRQLKQINGSSEYVFPNFGRLNAPMSGSTINAAFERIGYGNGKFTPHGLRKTASTILNEQGFRSDVIERQLAHAERNKVRAAYNHAEYLPERRQMMRHWADYLDGLASGNVLSFQNGKAA